MERGGTAPPGDLGCARWNGLRAGLAKGLHSKGPGGRISFFWKKQVSSAPGGTLSLRPWLGRALLWEVLFDSLRSDLAILLDPYKTARQPEPAKSGRDSSPPVPPPTFLPAPTIAYYDLCHPRIPPDPLPPPHPVCVCPFHSRLCLPPPPSNCLWFYRTPPCSQLSACSPSTPTLTGLLSRPLTVSSAPSRSNSPTPDPGLCQGVSLPPHRFHFVQQLY